VDVKVYNISMSTARIQYKDIIREMIEITDEDIDNTELLDIFEESDLLQSKEPKRKLFENRSRKRKRQEKSELEELVGKLAHGGNPLDEYDEDIFAEHAIHILTMNQMETEEVKLPKNLLPIAELFNLMKTTLTNEQLVRLIEVLKKHKNTWSEEQRMEK
jgi:FtsZ-binding cell division protein ZapB